METSSSIWPDVAPAPFLDTEEGRMSQRAAMPHLCFPLLGHIAFFPGAGIVFLQAFLFNAHE